MSKQRGLFFCSTTGFALNYIPNMGAGATREKEKKKTIYIERENVVRERGSMIEALKVSLTWCLLNILSNNY